MNRSREVGRFWNGISLVANRLSRTFSNLKTVTQADGTAELKTVLHAVSRAR